MSANRRYSQDVEELTFEGWLEVCSEHPLVRVQGKVERSTKERGRLVRFNRVFLVDVNDVVWAGDHPYVRCRRMRWDRKAKVWRWRGEWHTLAWRLVDWVTWQLGGDPNGSWAKVSDIR